MPINWPWLVILDYDVYKVDNDSSMANLLRGSLKRKEFWHFSLINCIFSVSLNKAFATKYLIAIFASPYNHSFRLARGILLNLQCANRFCNLITKYSLLVFSTILIKMLDKNIREYSKIRFQNTLKYILSVTIIFSSFRISCL